MLQHCHDLFSPPTLQLEHNDMTLIVGNVVTTGHVTLGELKLDKRGYRRIDLGKQMQSAVWNLGRGRRRAVAERYTRRVKLQIRHRCAALPLNGLKQTNKTNTVLRPSCKRNSSVANGGALVTSNLACALCESVN